MQPYFFGASDRRLFGVADDPPVDADRRCAVVLCYPYGQDYVYAFRPYRSLATRLSRVGFFALRFDYSGTGDSALEIDHTTPRTWAADVRAAVDEVRSLGYASVSLVGFRFGAAMAVAASSECRFVDRLVLWDPILDGETYSAALLAGHATWFRELTMAVPGARRLSPDGELFGFRFTDNFRRDLEGVNLWSLARRPAREVLIISGFESPEYGRFAEHLRSLGASVQIKTVEDVRISSMRPGMPNALVPNRVLQEIVSWLGRAALD